MMNYDLMRLLDKYAGTLICLFISFANIFKNKQRYIYPKRILITKFWGIGSIILASPTMKAVREKFPDAKITFLTLEKNKGLYEDSGLFNEIIYFKLNNITDVFLSSLRTILRIRKQKFDLVLDLDIFPMFTPVLLSFCNIKIKVGHGLSKTRKTRMYDRSAVYNNKQHISDSLFDLARLLGIEHKPDVVKIPASKNDQNYVNKILKEGSIKKSDKLIGINVNASDFGTARRWPYKNFAILSDELLKSYKVKIVFIGAKFDKELVEKTITSMRNKNVINLAGKTTIKQLAYLIEGLDFLITNDSGPMHIAVAMKTPVIAFFGPETPLIYGPLGKNDIAIYKHLPCSPCLSMYNAKRINCKNDAKCIKSIDINEVMEKVNVYLGNKFVY